MDHIRLRATIKLNGNQVVDLDALKPDIERAIAAALPAHIAVDTVKVTRINEATPAPDAGPAHLIAGTPASTGE